jgi:transcriptional regulator
MYLPAAFEETDERVLHRFIRAHPLATFVNVDQGELCANHFPMLIENDDDGRPVLRGHVARANPLWKSLGAGASALAIFHDAGLYVTPSWYPSKQETGRVVPTWNYVAVHASGKARTVDDARWLRSFLTRLTDFNESRFAAPWKITDAPEDHIERQLKAIVGIELAIAQMTGKWKVSQNRTAKDAEGVVAGLRVQGDPAALAMADRVDARRPKT